MCFSLTFQLLANGDQANVRSESCGRETMLSSEVFVPRRITILYMEHGQLFPGRLHVYVSRENNFYSLYISHCISFPLRSHRVQLIIPDSLKKTN